VAREYSPKSTAAKKTNDNKLPKGEAFQDVEGYKIPTKSKEKTTTTAGNNKSKPVPGFGSKSGAVANYPNDAVRLDLFNAVGVYLGTDYRVPGWSVDQPTNKINQRRQKSISSEVSSNFKISLNVDEDTQRLGYVAGRYNLSYKFHRNILGSGDGHKLLIQEISANGLEVRVRPIMSDTIDNTGFVQFFQEGLFKTPKSQVLSGLFLFENEVSSTPVFDYVQDKFTINTAPYSIIIKLSAPVGAGVRVGSEMWLAQQISRDFSTNTTLKPPNLKPEPKRIAGPNYDVIAKTRTGVSTEYKDSGDILSGNIDTQYNIQNRILSSSYIEGISLNVDYRDFNNYIKYSSAVSRITNFKYKLRLVENHDATIASLTSDLNGLPGSAASSSLAFANNITISRNRKSAVIGGFDAYEKYLYYSSASYETSSFGEYWPTTWPKQNGAMPYVNYSVSSSQAESWFEGAIASASLYDNNNLDVLTRSVPAHIIEDSDNETYITFVNLAGQYFDDILPYIDEYTNRTNRSQELSEGMSGDLLYLLGENLGFEFENGSALSDLWSYALGTDSSGSSDTIYNTTVEDTMKGTWKRIINNLPYLIRTKGTERCLRALVNCFGLPDTIIRIKEYGGHEGSFDKKSDFVYDRFYYAFVAGYNGQTSGLPAQQVKAPWQAVSQSGLFPQTTELRARMADNQTKDQTIFESPNRWKVRAFQSESAGVVGKYVGFFLSGSQGWATSSVMSSSIYDTDTEDPYTDQDTRWHHIALRRETQTDTPTDNQTYTLIVKTTRYNKVTSTTTSSLFIDGSTSSSYNNAFTSASNIWIPGSGSYALADSHSMDLFSGSVQELRYWTSELQDAILDNHALTPTSFQGNTDGIFTGSTSSFDTLAYRLTLGTDNKTTLDDHYPATSSFNSQHPDQGITVPSASFYNVTSSAYYRVTEQNSLEWPDLGANRSVSTKIRIDSTVLLDAQLFRNSKVEKPLSDNNPPDSSKLGVFLSPASEVNQDIAEQFGGISIDDYIGDPRHLSYDDYPDLQKLARVYSKKYTKLNKPNEYIRLLQHYNAALFQLIKRFVPYRANTQTGLLIEPTILERSKISTPPPVVKDLTLSASLILTPDVIFPPKGEVEDGANDPQPNYVKEATIGGDQSDYLELSGVAEEIIPTNNEAKIDLLFIDPTGVQSAYAETETPIDLNTTTVGGSYYEMEEGPAIDLAIDGSGWDTRYQGSKYIYMTYASSGSSPRVLTYVTASRYDVWDPIQPIIRTSTVSERSSPGDYKYQKDIWNYKAFSALQTTSNYETLYTSSAAVSTDPWTNNLGLTFHKTYKATTTVSTFTTADYWHIGNRSVPTQWGGGLGFRSYSTVGTGVGFTGSAEIDAFFYDRPDLDTTNYKYRIKGTCVFQMSGSSSNISGSAAATFYMGGLDSNITQSLVFPNTPIFYGTAVRSFDFDFIRRVDGPQLGLTFAVFGESDVLYADLSIDNLVVQPLNYGAQAQDFHLWDSAGMVNARYNGCKLTSTDYNVDSPDTVDGGPVITITEGGGRILKAQPTKQKGTFEIL
jgi:hypothetical protein